MLKFLKWLLLLPIIIFALVLAVGNRHPVPVYFELSNPFSPDLLINMPLFMVAWIGVIAGVILGGTIMWWRQGLWRSRARKAEAALVTATTDNDKLRSEIIRLSPPSESPSGLPVLFSK